MKWTMGDIQTALNEKEYIDTAVIPIIQISWGKDKIESVIGSEYMQAFCEVMENMYRGRVILFPRLSYINRDGNFLLHQLNKLEEQLEENSIQHIFYIVSDLQIKALENKLIGNIIWLPPIPLHTLDSNQQKEILETQVKSVMLDLEEKWKREKIETIDGA